MRGKTMINFITTYHINVLKEKNSNFQCHKFQKSNGKSFPLTYDEKDLLEN